MLTFRFLLSIAFVSIHLLCWAQQVGVTALPKDKIASNDSIQNVNRRPDKNNSTYKMKNYFSINPVGLMIGDLPLLYERNIKGNFNIQVGAGITFDNTMYDLVVSNFFPHFVNNSNLDNNFLRNTTIGTSFMIEPKYYFYKRKNFQGFYVGMQYRFRKYMYNSSQYDFLTSNECYCDQDVYTTASLGRTIHESRQVSDFLIELGGSQFIGKHFNFQYYYGVGVRNNLFYSAYMANYTIGNNNQMTSYSLTEGITSKTGFAFIGGFRMGYVF